MLSRCQPTFRSHFGTHPPCRSPQSHTRNSSYFNFELSTFNASRLIPLHGCPACPEVRRKLRSATLTGHSQLIENADTLNPTSANLDAASSISPLPATLTKNTGVGGASLKSRNLDESFPLRSRHSPPATRHFPIIQSTSPNTPSPLSRPPSASPPKSPAQSSPLPDTSSPSIAQ